MAFLKHKKDDDEDFTIKDFEVSEEIVEDFNYYYKTDDEIIENAKLKRKQFIFSILIYTVLAFILFTVVGGIRMATYHTDKILTNGYLAKIEYIDDIEEAYRSCLSFYDKTSQSGTVYKAFENETELETYRDLFADYGELIISYNPKIEKISGDDIDYVTLHSTLSTCVTTVQSLLKLSEPDEELLNTYYDGVLTNLSIAYENVKSKI